MGSTSVYSCSGVLRLILDGCWGFSVISALSTLAFEGRRHEYFKRELLNALTIINDGHISMNEMTGSWAGAMGQCQFMPSSF